MMRVVVAPTPASRAPLARHASRASVDRGAGRPRVRVPRTARRSPTRVNLRGGRPVSTPRRRPSAFVATDEPDTPDRSSPSGDVLGPIMRRIEAEGTPLALGRGTRGEADGERAIRVHPDARYVLQPGIGPNGAALYESKGAKAYALLCDRFVGTEDRELFECARRTTRVAAVSPTEIVTRWEVTFVPEKIRWMVALGGWWPGVSVEFYDILHLMDQRSRFTWRGLFRVFATAAIEKKMRVPMAKIEGTTRCRFELESFNSNDAASPPSLIATEETVDLIGYLNEHRVQNKRLARDALAFLDARKPPAMSLEAWDEQVEDATRWRFVPGMGQFDVDGLEDAEDRNEVFADAMTLLAFGTVVTLTFAWAFGGWYLHGLERDAAMLAMTRDGYYD